MTKTKRENHLSPRVHETKRGATRAIFPHAVSITDGRLIYLSGQLAFNSDGKPVGRGDMAAQYVQVCENIKAVLEDAGASFDDIVKINTFVTDMDAHMACLDLRLRYFGASWPTSTTVEIRKLAHPDMMIEIEAIAIAD